MKFKTGPCFFVYTRMWIYVYASLGASGRVGQIRVNLRRDIDAASYGHCEVQEIRDAEQSGDDLILIAKRFMADSEPFKVVTLMTAEQAATLRRSFAQPDGDWSRRPISDKVKRTIRTKAPLCVQQGVVSVEAAAYLTNWAEGTLQRLPRPQSYQFLTYRAFGQNMPGPTVPWVQTFLAVTGAKLFPGVISSAQTKICNTLLWPLRWTGAGGNHHQYGKLFGSTRKSWYT